MIDFTCLITIIIQDAACGEADKEEEEQAEDDEDESEEEDLEAALEIEQQRRLQRSVFEKDKVTISSACLFLLSCQFFHDLLFAVILSSLIFFVIYSSFVVALPNSFAAFSSSLVISVLCFYLFLFASQAKLTIYTP